MFRKNKSRASRLTNAKRSNSRHPQFEKLEKRELFAVDAFVQQGTLYIYGTNDNDQIQVRFQNGFIDIPGASIRKSDGQTALRLARSEVPYQVIATGQGGNDRIEIVEAGDTALPAILFGNGGNDILIGGSNDDVLVGQDGIDQLFGNGGSDKLIAALYANGQDPVQASSPRELLYGGTGNDTLFGSGGGDILLGGDGDDQLYGLGGDDALSGGRGNNTFDGGSGIDMLIEDDLDSALLTPTQFSGSFSSVNSGGSRLIQRFNVPIISIEKASLTARQEAGGVRLDASTFRGNVSLTGSDGADVLLGGLGNDELSGLAGNDSIYGNAGTDILSGGDGVDRIDGGTDSDTLRETILSSVALSATALTRGSDASQNDTISQIEKVELATSASVVAADTSNFAGMVTLNFANGSNIKINSLPNGTIAQGTRQEIVNFYRGLVALLGPAVRSPIDINGGQYVMYRSGTIYWSPRTGAHVLLGKFAQRYELAGGASGPLGFPKSNLIKESSYAMYQFEHGGIVLNSNRFFVLQGDIHTKWRANFRSLGAPIEETRNLKDPNWTMTVFERGAVFQGKYSGQLYAVYNPLVAGQAAPVHIFSKWISAGMENGILGYPSSDTHSGPNGGIYNTFQSGAILWHPSTGVHTVNGLIYEKYWNHYDGPWGRLGYPVADEAKSGKFFFSRFANGEIDFDSSARGFYVWQKNNVGYDRIERPRNPYLPVIVTSYAIFEASLRDRPVSQN